MFTDRFIEVPIELFDKKQADLIDKTDSTPAIAKINPFEITMYCEAVEQKANVEDESMEDLTETMVYFKNGDSLYVTLDIKEFEKLLNKAME